MSAKFQIFGVIVLYVAHLWGQSAYTTVESEA